MIPEPWMLLKSQMRGTKMSEQELSKKLAEWAGFEGRYVNRYEVGGGTGVYAGWEYPNGVHRLRPPSFTQSLDACFKWLVPEAQKRDINLRIVVSVQGLSTTVEIFGSNLFDDDYPTKKLAWAMDEIPALAFCKAIEKLIDELP